MAGRPLDPVEAGLLRLGVLPRAAALAGCAVATREKGWGSVEAGRWDTFASASASASRTDAPSHRQG